MALSRWWGLGLLGVAVAIAIVITASSPSATEVALAAAGVVMLLGGWALAGRTARDGDARALGYSAAIIVASGLLVAAEPILAIVQGVACPLLWLLSGRVRGAVVATVLLVLAVSAGFLVSTGTSTAALVANGITEALSFIFSIALGLWITRIATESAQRQRLLDELAAAQDEVAALHRDAGVTSERERLARELHDTLAQSLAGLVLLAQRARREQAGGGIRPETLELLEDGAREALAETRTLVAASAPADLDGGVAASLTRLAARFERETGVRIEADVVEPPALDRDSQVVVLRCAQEGLANIRKHAAATHARVELDVTDGVATVRVRDDGRGFDPDAVAGAGFGLRGLRDRLALVGGSLEIASTPGETVLTARLPVVRAGAAA